MTYTLSYVNLPNVFGDEDEVHYDKEFSSYEQIEMFVKKVHPDFTSFQVIVGAA